VKLLLVLTTWLLLAAAVVALNMAVGAAQVVIEN
jgi:hypothetical protein